MDDTILTEQAILSVMRDARRQGLLLMWTVTWNTSDYPREAVIRPHAVGHGAYWPLPYVIVADSLNEVRQKLPPGLTKLDRQDEDDPCIIEVWR